MIYDYKSDELTQEVYIQCICPIVDDIIDEYSTLRRYENISNRFIVIGCNSCSCAG